VSEESPHHLQQDLLTHVEQITATGRDAGADTRHRLVVFARADRREDDRPYGPEVGISRGHLSVLVQNLDELAKMGVPPVAARPFALFEESVDRLLC